MVVEHHHLDERNTLTALLQVQRAAVVQALDGLGDVITMLEHVPSGTTLLGIVQHLAHVERWWFRTVMAGEELTHIWTDDDPDADWRPEIDAKASDVIAFYREQCQIADTIIAAHTLDGVAIGEIQDEGPRRPTPSLRWILVHMIEETARHAGHADILRELTDGVTAR